MTPAYDLAIAGSGFAGSLMTAIGRRMGLSVILLERGRHPRVVIGESSTPLSNLLLETLAQRYDLPWLTPLTKWGTWQQTYPDLACGLKRGFTFFHHPVDSQFSTTGTSSPADRQLLVAASPNDAIADTHWFRADVDTFLLRQAIAMGADFLDDCDVQAAERDDQQWRIECTVNTVPCSLTAKFLIDATGPRGLMHKLLGLEDVCLPGLPATSALYGHFTGVSESLRSQHLRQSAPPYPPDAAALHHVFPGGWMWVLPFNNGWTSAGFAVTHAVARQFRLQEKEGAWARLLEALPEVKAQFAGAQQMRPFTYVPELSFRTSAIAGDGWAMLPSAAGFVDPLLSTGFPLTLLGVLRLGGILQQQWGKPGLAACLETYARQTEGELLATADLIGALYANMDDFATFRALTLLYFAAASYAEAVRRLGKNELAEAFLLHTHPVFGPGLRELTARARQPLSQAERGALQADILRFIEPFDVAGLSTPALDHCYPVRASDLFAGAHKLHATRADIEELLRRTGFEDAGISATSPAQA